MASIVIKNFPLPVRLIHAMSFKLGINVAVGNQHIRPSIIVIIKEANAPPHEARIEPSTRRGNHVCKTSIAVVMVQVGSVVDEIGLENIQETIAVIIARRKSHACATPALL